MAKSRNSAASSGANAQNLGPSGNATDPWQPYVTAVMNRFNREYRREPFELPEAVEAMPIFQEWAAGQLQAKLTSPFWQLAQPRKQQRCLDLGCGVSFLIYPWRDWDAFFYGQEISASAKEMLMARGPQLNSKLFKGVQTGPAHRLAYDADQFDLAIATGFSCYYPLTYWSEVMAAVQHVLKPDGVFVFDVINADLPLAENWAILETYLGAEVFLESQADWEKTIAAAGGKIKGQQEGELFRLYKVKF